MKAKLIVYYLLSFLLSCLVIVSANILFMRNRIYSQEDVYNYYPAELMEEIESSIQLSEDGDISLSDSAKTSLKRNKAGLQIIDGSNREVYGYEKPLEASDRYTGSSLLKLYASDGTTTFLEDIDLNGATYSYLLFLDSSSVKRMVYSYDVLLMQEAHSFTTLVAINLLLVLLISLLYTLKITRPIGSVLNKIVDLSKGKYEKSKSVTGIYSDILSYLDDLGYRLAQSQVERDNLEKMRNEWISNISHDIKTPLTSIIGNTEIIADSRYDLSEPMREDYCNRILKQSRYIKTLVEDLNFSTKLNSPYFKLNRQATNIVSLVRHTTIDLLNSQGFNHESINFSSSHEGIELLLDPYLMERAFINLISNAFIHNKGHVVVSIYLEKRASSVFISIEDNGVGVSEKELDSIFNRYYRGTDTSKGSEGSGLGLAITRDIVELHGGVIEAKTVSSGGLNIEINLPSKAY